MLADSSWHQGVVGIVASRLTEQFGCPVFMICLSGGIGKGSCRSYGGINLFAVLEGCQDLLEAFGGHELAAGFTVREENIPALTRRIAQQVRQQAGSAREPELEVDAELDDPRILELRGVELLEELEPYGTGNPRPVLALTGAQVMSHAAVGGGRHLKLKLGKGGVTLDAIFFSAGDWQPQPGSRVDVAFYPQINEYRGVRMVQLHLVDARPAVSRAQYERALYEKYRRGEELTCAQVRRLIPEREQFVVLWRYLKQQTDRYHAVEDTAAHIARAAARAAGSMESVLHTLICLDVLQERGLITMSAHGDRLRICLNPTQKKVDLEQSEILRRLRGMLCD